MAATDVPAVQSTLRAATPAIATTRRKEARVMSGKRETSSRVGARLLVTIVLSFYDSMDRAR